MMRVLRTTLRCASRRRRAPRWPCARSRRAPAARPSSTSCCSTWPSRTPTADGTAALADDSRRLLRGIPGVESVWVGPKALDDRDAHVKDYDVALCVRLRSLADLNAYGSAPAAPRAGREVEGPRDLARHRLLRPLPAATADSRRQRPRVYQIGPGRLVVEPLAPHGVRVAVVVDVHLVVVAEGVAEAARAGCTSNPGT